MAVIIRKTYTDGENILKCYFPPDEKKSKLRICIEGLDDDFDSKRIELNQDDLEELILDLNKYLITLKNENKNG
jgi:hypothetical protein